MKSIFSLALLIFVLSTSCAQKNNNDNQPATSAQKIGGACEGCEAIYESPIAFEKLDELEWLPDWNDAGQKLAINGVVHHPDGSAAAGVIIYVYHTDQTGRYTAGSNEKGWGKRHGSLRGWMKTNEKGEYKFFTLKPAPYPGGKIPAHIHITIKEPGKNEYWIDEYLFDDDPFLTLEERSHAENRGGSGIIKPILAGNILKAQRDIFLGKNIPGYPKQ